jgi:hypothetical protein
MEKFRLIESSRMCPICNKTKNHLQRLIIHLAQTHKTLEGLVDPKILENLRQNLKKAQVSFF